ncbi:ankyrin repeat domain-containing protein [Wolbachia endosymbiont of Chironomus riparius]|uniref:ankyrin repeat domain-containing protein n=1 Tax=Wolbachia endosymbiont of Chironomus riparius TaxID=2883238 RepID=UPI00209FB9B5|nr:ankyrin repeat domain-containing protein [Wolbachia endosymbiont of Chironomus riparius]
MNIDAKNRNGVAPIHIAAKYGNEHLIDFFLENRANINLECGNLQNQKLML